MQSFSKRHDNEKLDYQNVKFNLKLIENLLRVQTQTGSYKVGRKPLMTKILQTHLLTKKVSLHQILTSEGRYILPWGMWEFANFNLIKETS